jgi:hypothetical protein
MYRIFFRLVSVPLALSAAACGGDKDPEACPVLPPCISGSTWNATTCACVLEDEVPDAAGGSKKDHASDIDGRFYPGEAHESDGGGETSDAADDASD